MVRVSLPFPDVPRHRRGTSLGGESVVNLCVVVFLVKSGKSWDQKRLKTMRKKPDSDVSVTPKDPERLSRRRVLREIVRLVGRDDGPRTKYRFGDVVY